MVDSTAFVLAREHLGRATTPLAAYLELQLRLMRCFVRLSGDSPAAFIDRYARAYRHRYGWMLTRRTLDR